MAKATTQGINAAFFSAYGRKPTKGEVDHWLKKDDTELRDALRKDPKAKGVYADYRKQQAGMVATKGKYISDPSQLKGKTESDIIREKGGRIYEKTYVPKTTTTPTVPTTPTAPTTPATPLTYDQWLKGPGQSYANAYDPKNLEKEYGPYYAKLLGGEEANKQIATDVYSQNKVQTTENYGTNYNDAGIYGSGIYQKELGKALTNLGKDYNNQWGTGQYTPYSLRLADIEQQKKEAIANAELTRKNQAFSTYSTQYYPLLNQ